MKTIIMSKILDMILIIPVLTNHNPHKTPSIIKEFCEIRIRKLKQDFNVWGSEVQKKEQAYNEEQYSAARRRMLSIPFVEEDDYIPLGDIIARYSTSKAITPYLPIEEPAYSLIMEDEHLNTLPATELDEIIKSSVENLVPIPSESKGLSNNICDVPSCDNSHFDAESLLSRDILITSPKIDFLSEEFTGELAPIRLGMNEDKFDEEKDDCYDDDTSSDDDDFENIEYVDATPPNSKLDSVEEVEDVILRNKLSNVYLLISKIEALNDNPTLSSFSYSDNSYSDHTEETRSGNTTTHANNSLPEYDSFLFEVEPDQEGLTNNSNDPEFESFHFDLEPSPLRPPPEPPDVCLSFKPDTAVKNDENFSQGVIVLPLNVEDVNSFTFVIWIFLPYFTYPEESPLFLSFRNEDLVFDPGISTFHFSFKPVPFALPKDK
ncbi:hypothetical protein Tco_1007083 [Tanacetum coccineum]